MDEFLLDAITNIARHNPQMAFDGALAAFGGYDQASLDTFEAPQTTLLDPLTGQPLKVRSCVGIDLRHEDEVDEDDEEGSFYSVGLTTFADGTRLIEIGMYGIALVHRAGDALGDGPFYYMHDDKLEGYRLHGQLTPGDFKDRDEALRLLDRHGILAKDASDEDRTYFLRTHGLGSFATA